MTQKIRLHRNPQLIP